MGTPAFAVPCLEALFDVADVQLVVTQPDKPQGRGLTLTPTQVKVLAQERGVAVLSQVDGARWLSLEGSATVSGDPDDVRDAELRYAQRYRTPRVNPRRVVIEVRIERVLGSSTLLDRTEA